MVLPAALTALLTLVLSAALLQFCLKVGYSTLPVLRVVHTIGLLDKSCSINWLWFVTYSLFFHAFAETLSRLFLYHSEWKVDWLSRLRDHQVRKLPSLSELKWETGNLCILSLATQTYFKFIIRTLASSSMSCSALKIWSEVWEPGKLSSCAASPLSFVSFCSHFHLDHCGALPYFSEMVGYDGPIYMTHPTKAICPILLEDYRKITVDKKGETNFFTSQMIKDCMKKVVAVHLHQTVQVNDHFCILLARTNWIIVEGRAIFIF